ncbi:hypothetical protein GGR58DRAFT_528730 [Xylaria digitata]|nr:hypothetical protein GGR58DRAFT_528730 [Xylaria digitata]
MPGSAKQVVTKMETFAGEAPFQYVPATATATAPGRHPAVVDLTRHSLNAVVARDKTLWQQPLKWTRAHLSALGIRRRRWGGHGIRRTSTTGTEEAVEDGSDTDDDEHNGYEDGTGGEGGGGEEEEDCQAVIPDMPPTLLSEQIKTLIKYVPYELRVPSLIALLRIPRQPKSTSTSTATAAPITKTTVDNTVDRDRDRERQEEGVVVGRAFSCRWTAPGLAVGPRTYRFPPLFHLYLDDDALVLPYIDSSRVLAPPFPVCRRRDLTRPFEPFIAAVLIARAQSSSSPLKEGGSKAEKAEGQSDADG